MADITFQYELSRDFLRKHFLETGVDLPSLQTVSIDPTSMTRSQREGLVALRGLFSSTVDLERPSATERGYVTKNRIAVDHLLTADEIGSILESYPSDLAAAETSAAEQKALTEAKEAAEQAERKRRYAEEIAREEARKAKEAAEAAERDAVKRAWINEHGSDGLKARVEAGYDCQKMYVTERAAIELHGFVIDWKERADWKARSCPSDAGFAIERELEAKGIHAVVVWLTDSPVTPGDYYDRFEAREAVVVRGYLGKYDAIRFDY